MKRTEVNNNKMKAFETAMDQVVAPEMYIISRLNVMGQRDLGGQRGSRRSNDLQLEAMIETTQHLMTCGFNVTYANTTNHEIALLFDLHESSFGRKTNKFNSMLASEGSAKLTQVTDELAVLNCRTVALPNKSLVVEYFNWRAALSKTSHRAWSFWQTLPGSRRELVTIDNTEVIAAYDDAMMNI